MLLIKIAIDMVTFKRDIQILCYVCLVFLLEKLLYIQRCGTDDTITVKIKHGIEEFNHITECPLHQHTQCASNTRHLAVCSTLENKLYIGQINQIILLANKIDDSSALAVGKDIPTCDDTYSLDKKRNTSIVTDSSLAKQIGMGDDGCMMNVTNYTGLRFRTVGMTNESIYCVTGELENNVHFIFLENEMLNKPVYSSYYSYILY